MSLPDWAPAGVDETVVWQGQPRLGVIVPAVGFGVLAGVAIGGIAAGISRLFVTSSVLVAAVGVLCGGLTASVVIGVAWLWRRSTRYLLTDAALYHRSGVFRLTVTKLPVEKIQNTSYTQSVLGTIFDHGTVTIDTAGSSGAELTLRGLDGPQAVQQQIARAVPSVTNNTALPGTVEQWNAIHTEVCRLKEVVEQ